MKNSSERHSTREFAHRRLNQFILCLFALQSMLMTPVIRAAVTVKSADELWTDSFDTNNIAGAVPSQWKAKVAPGITTRIVDARITEPASSPYCVELRDNNLKERAQLWRSFPPSNSGTVTASFKLRTLATAHAGVQLRTAKGEHLCSVIFLKEGVMRFDYQGGTEKSDVKWALGKWQEVQIEWFADFTFSAAVEGQQLVEHAHFVTNATPARIEFIVGSDTSTNKIAYIDNVTVSGASQ